MCIIAQDSDPSRTRTILLMIAELYRVEKLARERGLTSEDCRCRANRTRSQSWKSCTRI